MSPFRPKSKRTSPAPQDGRSAETDSRGEQLRQRSAHPLSRRRRWAFRLVAAVLLPTIFFGVVELALRLAGAGYPTQFLIPAEAQPGWLRDNYQFAWRFFPRPLARSSQPILVPRQKPPGMTRVVVFGGSAAMGDPEPAFGFPRVLQTLLEMRYPGQEFEVINAAMTAINSHVVLPIGKDCRDLDADVWVVYMGNNEVVGPFGAGTVFSGRETPLWLIRGGLALRRTKTGQLLSELVPQPDSSQLGSWGGMKMFLDHQVRRDDPALNRVYEQFQQNLDDLLEVAANRRTPVLVGTVVSNLRNCAPFASLHRKSISPDTRRRWQAAYSRGCEQQAEGQFEEAIRAFEQAYSLDPTFAELTYRLGECRLQLGDSVTARERFREARDLDTLRFRASSRINEIIHSCTQSRRETGVRFVDAAAQFAERSPSGITGEEFLCEHVHFNFTGNYLLARLFAVELSDVLKLSTEGVRQDEWPSEQQCAERMGLTPYHRLLFAKELRMRLGAPPFDRQLHHEARDAKLESEMTHLASSLTEATARTAIQNYKELLERHPDDWVLREQYGVLLESLGDMEKAAQQWSIVTKQLPHHAEAFCQLGLLRNRARQWKDAEQPLRTALQLHPEYALRVE